MRSQTTKHLAVPGPDFAHLLHSFFQTSNWVRGLTRWAFANASVRSNCYSNSFRLNRPAQRSGGPNFLPPTQKTKPKRDEIERERERREGEERIDEMQFVAFFSSHRLIQTRFIFNRRLFEDEMEKKSPLPFFPSSFLSLFLSHLFSISCFSLFLNIFTSNFQRVVTSPSFPSRYKIPSTPLLDSRFSELVK